MAVPLKFREIGDFHEYYSGVRVAPYLTVFVGGNHEASNHLWELYYGGWVAPNIYYMGAANVLRLGPLRIAGLSGIWKGYNYRKPHYERLPYSQDDVRSIYHVRELDTRKLLQIRTPVDVGISHDWPRGVEWLGNFKELFRKKDRFEADAKDGSLGSMAAKLVLDRLRPTYWFSAHLHVKYAALVNHSKVGLLDRHMAVRADRDVKSLPVDGVVKGDGDQNLDIDVADFSIPTGTAKVHNTAEIDLDSDDETANSTVDEVAPKPVLNDDEIYLGDEDDKLPPMFGAPDSSKTSEPGDGKQEASVVDEVIRALLPASFARPTPKLSQSEPPTQIRNEKTQFLALDKCLPRRDFLQILQINPINGPDTDSSHFLSRPLKLSYDPEWLAVTRVFADELQLGDPSAHVGPDKGRAHYLPLIEQEEKWVEQNITTSGKLLVPENFTLTASIHDPTEALLPKSMPREYNNTQTITFCDLLNIQNPFSASEEDVEARMRAGPALEQPGSERFRGGRGGRGGRNSGRGGRGRARGRGRGK